MKKLLTIMLSVLMVCGLVACSSNKEAEPTETATTEPEATETATSDFPTAKDTYETFMAAENDSEVEVLMYVQAHQGWWEDNGQGVMTLYGMDNYGGYFVYNAKMDEATADSIEEGTLVKVTGTKTEWSGEVEIVDATVEVYADQDKAVMPANDVSDLMGDSEKLAAYMNQKVVINGLDVVKVETKDSEYDPDLYITCMQGDVEVNLCVENYLTGPDSEVYKTAQSLQEGDIIDVEGFLYWYEGANPHVTSITVE